VGRNGELEDDKMRKSKKKLGEGGERKEKKIGRF
jgi:hypothetical protein